MDMYHLCLLFCKLPAYYILHLKIIWTFMFFLLVCWSLMNWLVRIIYILSNILSYFHIAVSKIPSRINIREEADILFDVPRESSPSW